MTRAPWMPRAGLAPRSDAVWRDTVGPVAFDALLRDGHVHRVWGDLAVTDGLSVSPAHRAAAVRALVPARAALGRSTACWVHTGVGLPGRVEVLVGPRRRRPDPHPSRSTHECELPPEDLVLLAGVQVTSVQRTGLDVARWEPRSTARALLVALRQVGFDPYAALGQLPDLRGYAGVTDARRVLEPLAATEDASEAAPVRRQARITGSSAALAPVMR
ncbi:hypothetical protein ACGIF2_01465 [Cellulomonas sp. P22]|uniref:hypothetical protein n=1 Tax=Cellulomonas sp. P22 TaxID=3373189 RepID=UPI0037A70BA2